MNVVRAISSLDFKVSCELAFNNNNKTFMLQSASQDNRSKLNKSTNIICVLVVSKSTFWISIS